MTRQKPVETWLERARSNLLIAKQGLADGIFFEDLCFEAQQAAEKSLKGLLIYFIGDYPRTHSFTFLLSQLENHVFIPDEIKEVVELTDYAVQARYPGDYYPVTKAEYSRAIDIAQRVIDWVERQVG